MSIVVCDTGALISLEKLPDGYEFIRKLYTKLLIPPAVLEELTFDYNDVEAYFRQYRLHDLLELREARIKLDIPGQEALHDGELEAIRLAKELGSGLLIEEAAGRETAQQLTIPISGISKRVFRTSGGNR